MVSGLNVSELLTILNNSILSKDERFAVELVDLYEKQNKIAAYIIKLAEDFLDDKDAPKDKALIYAKAMHGEHHI